MPKPDDRLFPALLRYWRTRGGLSQLDLAVAADVSSRHVSFLETGRAQPSREMVLRLGATLGVPLRHQNAMLRAAGHPPEFVEPSADGVLPESVARAIDRMIAAHEPYPLLVFGRAYDIVRVSDGGARLLTHFVADPSALPTPVNALVLVFDPRLVRPFVVDWERIAHGLLARLHREVLARPADGELASLLRSLLEYPDVPESWRHPDFSTPPEPVFVLRLRRGALEIGFLTTVTAFNAPGNVGVEDVRIESYYPVDEASARTCEQLAR